MQTIPQLLIQELRTILAWKCGYISAAEACHKMGYITEQALNTIADYHGLMGATETDVARIEDDRESLSFYVRPTN